VLSGCPEHSLCLFTVDPNIGIVGPRRKWCHCRYVWPHAPLAACLGLAVPLCCSSGVISTDSHLYQSPRSFNSVSPPPGSTAWLLLLPRPKENNHGSVITSYLLSSARSIHVCRRGTTPRCWGGKGGRTGQNNLA